MAAKGFAGEHVEALHGRAGRDLPASIVRSTPSRVSSRSNATARSPWESVIQAERTPSDADTFGSSGFHFAGTVDELGWDASLGDASVVLGVVVVVSRAGRRRGPA